MARNSNKQDKQYERRRKVAQMRLRGLTMREIASSLTNPDTGNPYSATTINSDLKSLRKTWIDDSMIAVSEHKARQYAEIQAAKRKAWAGDDMPMLHKWITLEIKLLGTSEPIEINLNTIFTDLGLDTEDVINGYTDFIETSILATGSETSITQ